EAKKQMSCLVDPAQREQPVDQRVACTQIVRFVKFQHPLQVGDGLFCALRLPKRMRERILCPKVGAGFKAAPELPFLLSEVGGSKGTLARCHSLLKQADGLV